MRFLKTGIATNVQAASNIPLHFDVTYDPSTMQAEHTWDLSQKVESS